MATITLNLSTDLEHRLRKRAASKGVDVADAALELVEKGLSEEKTAVPARDLTPEERLKNFLEYLKDVPRIDVEIDDSRESIYEGRGE